MSQDKREKKRKRTAENGDHPSKKVVVDAPSQVVMVSILQDIGDWAPVIGKSPRNDCLSSLPQLLASPAQSTHDPVPNLSQHHHPAFPYPRSPPSNPTNEPAQPPPPVRHQPAEAPSPPQSYCSTPPTTPNSTAPPARKTPAGQKASSNTTSASTTPKPATCKSSKRATSC